MSGSILDSDYLKVGDAARLLGVTRRTIYRRIWSGNLPASKVGGLYYIRRSDIETMLEPGKKIEPDMPEKTDTLQKQDFLKCGACYRVMMSDSQIAEVCEEEDCENLICVQCWDKGVRFCAQHQPTPEDKWQQARQRLQAGELDVLVRGRNARLTEISFLNRLEERIRQIDTLMHPTSGQIFTVKDWDEIRESGDDRAQIMKILRKMVLDAETTSNTPLNAWVRWTINGDPKKKISPLVIQVQVLSRLSQMVPERFDTERMSDAELSPYLLEKAGQISEPTLMMIASTTGWNESARKLITGEKIGTAFVTPNLFVYLFDLQTNELIYNQDDDRLRGYADLFKPLLPGEEMSLVMRDIENQMIVYDSLTLQLATEVLPYDQKIIEKAFNKLAAEAGYQLSEIPGLGLVLTKTV